LDDFIAFLVVVDKFALVRGANVQTAAIATHAFLVLVLESFDQFGHPNAMQDDFHVRISA
jgi:hypothetical protein